MAEPNTQLDRIEQMLEDLLSRLGGQASASLEAECAMIKARGGSPVQHFKEKARRQMEADKRRGKR